MYSFSKKALFLLFLFLPFSAFAMFIQPSFVPVDRLIANTNAFLKENPKNHQALYMLARIHYLAFVNKANIVGVEGVTAKNPPAVAPDWLLGDFVYHARHKQAEVLTLKELGEESFQKLDDEKIKKYYALLQVKSQELNDQKWEPEKISQESLVNHVKEAILNFNKAIELDPKNGLYHLGLASLFSQYLNYKKTAEIKNEPKELKEISVEKARLTFYKAFSLSVKEDLKLDTKPISGLVSLVSYEAGNAFVELTNTLQKKNPEDTKLLEEVKDGIEKIKEIGKGKPVLMTPIIFTFASHNSILELLNPDIKVDFDLDGDGKKELWPWLNNNTGLLVWDPLHAGKITSGRQLFGSVTWWLFFENGYQALDSLDDNRDGQLTNEELMGISTWFDKNSNGISEPGEMFDLKTLGIKSIATKPTGETIGMPMNSAGMTLVNGKAIPTYDWITLPSSK